MKTSKSDSLNSKTMMNAQSKQLFEFPFKLHTILNDAEQEEKQYKLQLQEEQDGANDDKTKTLPLLPSIISWLPNGSGFRIHNIKKFEKYVLPCYYGDKAIKYRSFQRQLNIYNFQRVTDRKSEDYGAYHHPLLKRGNPELCLEMKRHKVKQNQPKTSTLPQSKRHFVLNQTKNRQDQNKLSCSGKKKSDSIHFSSGLVVNTHHQQERLSPQGHRHLIAQQQQNMGNDKAAIPNQSGSTNHFVCSPEESAAAASSSSSSRTALLDRRVGIGAYQNNPPPNNPIKEENALQPIQVVTRSPVCPVTTTKCSSSTSRSSTTSRNVPGSHPKEQDQGTTRRKGIMKSAVVAASGGDDDDYDEYYESFCFHDNLDQDDLWLLLECDAVMTRDLQKSGGYMEY